MNHTAKALVIVEWDDRIILATILPTVLEVSVESLTYETLAGYRHYTPGPSYLMIEGRILEEIRTWESWTDFYDDMGARPSSGPSDALPGGLKALPGADPLLPPGES